MALPERGRKTVAALDNAARDAGIAIGMTITKARSLCPELMVEEADLEGDAHGLLRLALWAGRRYSPFVAPDLPDGIWIDISGAAHRFGSEKAMLRDMFRRVTAAGYRVQIAVADTAGCAHAAARKVPSGRPVIIEPGKTRDAMMLLPVSSLNRARPWDRRRCLAFFVIDTSIRLSVSSVATEPSARRNCRISPRTVSNGS